jgi:MoxR-like ATPase
VTPTRPLPDSISATQALLAHHDYIADNDLSTALYLSLHLQRPLLLEGEPGTGKTEIARTIAQALNRPLIRLQCHDGLDMAGAAYEWNYARQMMEIRLMEGGTDKKDEAQRERLASSLFAQRFLIPRALLKAIDPAQPVPPVLLIDELDRADEAFEAYLLEVLSDFQITIPELGEIKAITPPIVILTSNRTREIHDAVKRRCLYHWVDFPDAARELSILQRRVPGASETLSRQVVAFVQGLREMDLFKQPGVAETLEWSRALLQLNALILDPHTVDSRLGVLLKYQDDIAKVKGSEAAKLLAQVQSSMAAA